MMELHPSRCEQLARADIIHTETSSTLGHKDMSFIAQYPGGWTAQSALHYTPGRLVHSGNNSTSPGKHFSHAANMREDYSLTFPPLSIARYSFIQLSGENENAQL